MIKRIHSTLFYAHDLDATFVFYKSLDFDVKKTPDAVRIKMGDFTMAFVDENKTEIKQESGAQPKGLGIFTYIEVDNVDEYFNFLKKQGIKTSSEPKTWSWGKREFVIRDLDGYKLVFYSSVSK